MRYARRTSYYCTAAPPPPRALLALSLVFVLGGSCSITPGHDCKGSDISNVESATPQSCCDLCVVTSRCKAFTHNQYDAKGHKNPTCYMKSACLNKVARSSCTSGEISAQPTPAPAPPAPVPVPVSPVAIDSSSVSISGISSGADFAAQFHTAFSSRLMGEHSILWL
jgi:hypothetical protein